MGYLLLDLAGDGRVGGVGNTLAAFVLHIDGCVVELFVVWLEDEGRSDDLQR